MHFDAVAVILMLILVAYYFCAFMGNTEMPLEHGQAALLWCRLGSLCPCGLIILNNGDLKQNEMISLIRDHNEIGGTSMQVSHG